MNKIKIQEDIIYILIKRLADIHTMRIILPISDCSPDNLVRIYENENPT